MNWIDFNKERPKEEPRRQILYKSYEGDYNLFMSTDKLDPAYMQRNYPEWAEIEPPNKPDRFVVRHAGDCSIYRADPEFPDADCHICDCGAFRNAAGTLDTDAYHQAKVKHDAAIASTLRQPKPPPKPDPFEEWFGVQFCESPAHEHIVKHYAKKAWDAAIKYVSELKPPREHAKPTGRRYSSVEDLMRGEGVSQEVQDMVKELGRLDSSEVEPVRAGMQGNEPPNKPDPFEEFWLSDGINQCGNGNRGASKIVWDAAIKYAKGEK